MKDDIINGQCAICGNVSSYDKESLKGSTHNINGIDIVLCCPCEDDLLKILLNNRISKKRMLELTENLMSAEREDFISLWNGELN